MKRSDPEQIGDVLRLTLRQEGMTQRLDETKAISIWPAVVGEAMASLCGKPMVFKGLMTIYVRSAALRQELNMCRSGLIRAINNELGKEVITDIRFK